jgi:hypothetical protein
MTPNRQLHQSRKQRRFAAMFCALSNWVFSCPPSPNWSYR